MKECDILPLIIKTQDIVDEILSSSPRDKKKKWYNGLYSIRNKLITVQKDYDEENDK